MKKTSVVTAFVFMLILLFTGLLLAENDQKLSEKKKQELSQQLSESLVPLDKEEKTLLNWKEEEFRKSLDEAYEEFRKIEEMVNGKLDQVAEKLGLYRENPEEIIKKAMDSWVEKRRSAVYIPALDKLAVKIRKGANGKTIQKEAEEVFEKLRKNLPSKSIFDPQSMLDILNWARKKTEKQLTEKKEKQSAKLFIEKIDESLNPCSENFFDKIEIEEVIDAWSEKRIKEIWGRLFDKLTDKKSEKSKIETTLKKIEKAFNELNVELLEEDNVQKELKKSLSVWIGKKCETREKGIIRDFLPKDIVP